MGESGQGRTSAQKAYDATRLANAAGNIARAAVTSGIEGAAVETAKEAAPRLIKLALCLLAVLLLIPMAVFAALPHVFFGFNNSKNPAVTEMTSQAMEIGSVCMSMDEFQKTVIDSIVTAIVNEYEEAGVSIDRIEVESHFEEKDLLWFIALNSVANQQNLDEISIDKIRDLCSDKLSFKSGGIQHGSGSSTGLDVSGFVNPSVKNNLDLVTYAIHAWENGWGYVWGTFGNVLTPSLFQYKLDQYPVGVGNYETFIRDHWVGRRTSDCIGLIKGYGWLNSNTLTINYGTNGTKQPDGKARRYKILVTIQSGQGKGRRKHCPGRPPLRRRGR